MRSRSVGLTEKQLGEPKSSESYKCRISKTAFGIIAFLGLSVAALAWRGKNLLQGRFTSFVSKAGVIGGLLTAAFVLYACLKEKRASPSRTSSSSSSSNPVISSSTSSSSSSSSTPLSSSNSSTSVISSSSSSSSSSSFSLSNSSINHKKTHHFNIKNLKEIADSFEKEEKFEPAVKTYFEIIIRLINEEKKEEADLEIPNLDRIFSHWTDHLNEIKNLSDCKKHLVDFSFIYKLSSAWIKDAILRACSNVMSLVNKIDSFLEGYNESADKIWKDALTFLIDQSTNLNDLDICFPKKKISQKLCAIRDDAFSHFWVSFSQKLTKSNQEDLIQELQLFISLVAKNDAFQKRAAVYFPEEIKKLDPSLTEVLNEVVAKFATQLLSGQELNILKLCFLHKESSVGQPFDPFLLNALLEKLKSSSSSKTFAQEFEKLIQKIASMRVITEIEKNSFRTQWRMSRVYLQEKDIPIILKSQVIPQAVKHLNERMGKLQAALLVDAMKVLAGDPPNSWLPKLYAEARKTFEELSSQTT